MAQIGTTPKFTTTDAVRSSLGVDSTDLPDAWILAAELDVELGLDLTTWMTNYSAKMSIDATTGTPEQLSLQAALQTYSKWYCALEYARKPLAFQQIYGDGKAEMRRFTNFDWEQVIASCAAKVAQFKDLALAIDPETDPLFDSGATFVLASGLAPTYDPVTNEGGT